jgi:hypothetical protein
MSEECSFFEKKEPKKLLEIGPRRSRQRGSNNQKFFASFFQKRRPSLC